MNERKLIYEAFAKISPGEETKKKVYDKIYRTVLTAESSDAAEEAAEPKAGFFRSRPNLVRVIPAVALCAVIVGAFGVFGVYFGSMLQMGSKAAEDQNGTGMVYQEAPPAAAKAQDDLLIGMEDNTEGYDIEAPEGADEENDGALYAGAGVYIADIYLPVEVGYTCYNVENTPRDPYLLWEEVRSLEGVPDDLYLTGCTLENSTLVLEFNGELQSLQDHSATTAMATGIAVTYRELYPDAVEVTFLSGGKPLVFEEQTVNISEETMQNLPVTNTVYLVFGEGE